MRAEWVARMALAYLVAALLVGGWAESRIDAAAVETACQEDDPCWDCATMGNLVCGPVVNR